LHGYALVFWSDPNDYQVWSRYYTALTDAARTLESERGWRFQIFHNITRHADSEDYRALHALVKTHRLAGMIMPDLHPDSFDLPLVTEPGVPRVVFQHLAPPGAIRVCLDGEVWMHKALDHFRSRGCKRLALLANHREGATELARMAAARGMACPPHWQQLISSNLAMAADHCVRLLMQGSARSRPDALLITDDHFIEDASTGLIAEGIRVPQDLEIVAHANFPLAARSVLPMRRIGFNMRTMLETAVEQIDCQRAGKTPAARTTVHAVWEDEVPVSVAVEA
jgi:DNA-binding LacI/PurR family transcriptional regulator